MDAERWQQLQVLFDAAVDLPDADRRAYLDEACSNDHSLRLQVESLIIASNEASQAIGHAVGEAAVEAVEPAQRGQRIGPYELERELGRGGMGVVFLARRADRAYEGQVAIKFLQELQGEEQRRRFQMERQILANLQHPNIARLLDAGTTDHRTPYVVIEYVDGLPITAYCDQHQLNADERIDLFLSVCNAVQHAHQNLIVHRDLKPENILVAGDGTTKLLDFGIAKLLADDGTDTMSGLRLMTPAYASPEQVKGEPITVATDVYGLGLILYRLLTGSLPYDLAGRSITEKARIICDQDPTRPSVLVSASGQATLSSDLVSTLRTPLRRLQNTLKGDLDTIILTALQKDPSRRYASVERFADDLLAYRSGRPVRARPDTLTYRVAKFVRRNRLGVAAATAFVVLLTAFGATMAVQANRIAKERDAARSARGTAEEVSGFLVDLFEVADPNESRGAEISAREILDRGAQKIDAELADQPENRATMMEVIGRVYRNLGLYDDAQKMFDGSIKIRRSLFSEDHPAVGRSLAALGGLQYDLGKYEEAEKLFRRAVAIAQQQTPHDTVYVARTLASLKNVVTSAGRLDEAIAIQNQVVALQRRLHADEHQDLAEAMVNLGALYRRQGAYDKAEPLLRDGLAIQQRVLGNDHLEVAYSLNNLARLLVLKNDPDAAEPYAREGLAIRRQNFGNEHVEVAASLGNLAGILRLQGKLTESVATREESLQVIRKHVGDGHPYVAATLSSLAAVQFEAGNIEAAEANYQKSLALHRKLFPASHPRTAFVLTGLGEMLVARARYSEAEPLLTEAVAIRRATLPSDHEFISASERALGACLMHLGQLDEAQTLLDKAHANLVRRFGASDTRALEAAAAVRQLKARRLEPAKDELR